MTITRLQIGSFSEESGTESEGSLEKEAILVYPGTFQSMDGEVEITKDHLSKLASNHNAVLSKLGRLATGAIPLRHCPPVQLDHQVTATHTVGRLVGNLEVKSVDLDGQTTEALCGRLRILGKENCEKVKDGRWIHLSIGADLEEGKLNEITITPFPAADHAAMLSKMKDVDGQAKREGMIGEIDAVIENGILSRRGPFELQCHCSGWDMARKVESIVKKFGATMTRQEIDKFNGMIYMKILEPKSWGSLLSSERPGQEPPIDTELGKLLISASSLEQMVEQISKFYYSKDIKLNQISDKEWSVSNAKGIIDDVKVVLKSGRYRFEATNLSKLPEGIKMALLGKKLTVDQVKKIIANYDVPLDNPYVKDLINNAVEASDVMSRSELEKFIEENLEILGTRVNFTKGTKMAEGDFKEVKTVGKYQINVGSTADGKFAFQLFKRGEGHVMNSGAKFDSKEAAIVAAEKYISEHSDLSKLSEGEDTMGYQEVKEKMAAFEKCKKHLMADGKTEEEAEKHMSEMDDDGVKKMAADSDEREKQLAEEQKKEEETKMSRMTKLNDSKVKLAAAQTKLAISQKKASLFVKLSSLRSQGKISPAEMKNVKYDEVSAKTEDEIKAFLSAFDTREPMIDPSVHGSKNGVSIVKLRKDLEMTTDEIETRARFTSNPENKKLAAKLAEIEEQGQAPIVKQAEDKPGEEKHLGDLESIHKMMEEGKHDEAKEKLSQYISACKTSSGEPVISPEDAEKHLSALAEAQKELNNTLKETQQLMTELA